MNDRYISDANLQELTSAQICTLWLNEEGYRYLQSQLDILTTRLHEASGIRAEEIATEISLITEVLDEYESNARGAV